jgi:endo-1,4-beta-xylanase
VPSTFNGEGSALLWDNNYQKKPAYDSFLKAITNTPVEKKQEEPKPVTSSASTTAAPTTTAAPAPSASAGGDCEAMILTKYVKI